MGERDEDLGMEFERAMRFFFGDKAYHIAGECGLASDRRLWLRKALRKVLSLIGSVSV